MNFKEWMLHQGLSPSTAEKYAGAIAGPLTEWGLAGGVLQGPLVAMESPAAYKIAASKLTELPIFVERNARGHNMYSSALNQFLRYIADGFPGDVGSDIEDVLIDPTVGSTEKIELIKARIGQGRFRQSLLLHWQCCAVTGHGELSMLVASHIKPWSKSSNVERLNPYNGLILIPNLDRAFDRGFITFDEAGKLLVSPLLAGAAALGIVEGTHIALSPAHQSFMAFHRSNVYRAT